MQLSANELKFLIKRSLEGMGFNPGEQLGAGMRIARACQYGLIDSHTIYQALTHLNPHIKAPVKIPASADHLSSVNKATVWCYDAGGQSALVQADLAVGAALSHGVKDILIQRTSQGIVLAPTLMSWLANPQGSSTIKQQVGIVVNYTPINPRTSKQIDADKAAIPALLVLAATGVPHALYRLHSTTLPTDHVRVLLGEDTINTQIDINNCTLLVDQSQFAANLDAALAQGIPISNQLFKYLQTLMLNSLVAESASSAAGAGPG